MRSLSVLGAAVSAALLASCAGGHSAAVPATTGGASQSAVRHAKTAVTGNGGVGCSYGLLVTGSKANVHVDAATIAGDLGVAASKANVHLNSTTVQGAGRFQSDANVHLQGSASIAGGQIVDAAGLASAVNAATSASTTDAAMASNTTAPAAIALGQGQSLTLTGTHTTNVVNVASIAMAAGSTLTFSAPAGSSFVVNVAGDADFQTVAVSGGMTAGDVVFNFTGTQGGAHVEAGASVAATLLSVGRGVQLDDGAVVGGSVVTDGGNLHAGTVTIQATCPTPPGLGCNITEYDIPNQYAEPVDIVAGSDGALWFAEYGAAAVGRITTAGTVTELRLPPQYPYIDDDMEGLATGPDGALWFTQVFGNQIGRMTTAGAVTQYSTGADPNGTSGQSEIAAGSDGAMWFTDTATNSIGRISPAGAVTEYPVPTQLASLHGIAAGPDGALWFTEFSSFGNRIGRITTAGAITEFAPLPSNNSGPSAITAGPDGAMWFTELTGDNTYNYGKVGRIDMSGNLTEYPMTARSQPLEIAPGPDGALYFTELQGNAIGRITTSGAVTHCPVPSANARVTGIVAGPDGAMWFTESIAEKIGRLH